MSSSTPEPAPPTDAAVPSSTAGQRQHPSPKSAIDFLMVVQNLKRTKRTGWVRKHVHQPESIADHMYRMGIMSLICSDAGVDTNRAIKIALVHDLAESLVGDITPHCAVTKEEKEARERQAMATLRDTLGHDTHVGAEIEELWHEYEDGTSPEALLVKDFDKLEMILQAHEYESSQEGLQLEEFFTSTAGKFKTPVGKAWAAEIVARRQAAKAVAVTAQGTTAAGPSEGAAQAT